MLLSVLKAVGTALLIFWGIEFIVCLVVIILWVLLSRDHNKPTCIITGKPCENEELKCVECPINKEEE